MVSMLVAKSGGNLNNLSTGSPKGIVADPQGDPAWGMKVTLNFTF
jgi:hypothetical protein